MSKSRLEFKKFSAAIKVDGKELECYAVLDDKSGKSVSCWIASEEGKNFSVIFKKEIRGFFRTIVTMDGSRVVNLNLGPSTGVKTWDYLETSETTGRHFRFSPLKVSDERTSVDAAVLQSKVLNDVGAIKIEVYGTVKRKIQTQKPHDSPEKGVRPPVIVSECLVKGKVMHQIAYGEEVEVENQTRNEGTHTYDVTTLLAEFTFRYRPLDVLQRAGIAPQEISCIPSESNPIVDVHMPPLQRDSDNSLHSLSDKRKSPLSDLQIDVKSIAIADDGDYRAREQALLAELEKLRREQAVNETSLTSGNRPRKRVKLEEHKEFFPRGEVIDLT